MSESSTFTIPIRCTACGNIFSSGVALSPDGSVASDAPSSFTCPRCNGAAALPSGLAELRTEALQVVRKLSPTTGAMVRAALRRTQDKEDVGTVSRRVERLAPEAATWLRRWDKKLDGFFIPLHMLITCLSAKQSGAVPAAAKEPAKAKAPAESATSAAPESESADKGEAEAVKQQKKKDHSRIKRKQSQDSRRKNRK